MIEPKAWVLILSTATTIAAGSPPVVAHPGGLNAEGCHTNRKTGDYHCHRRSTRNAAVARPMLSGNGAYRNCTAARAAGAAPVYADDPGYGRHLDRDGDGVGCE